MCLTVGINLASGAMQRLGGTELFTCNVRMNGNYAGNRRILSPQSSEGSCEIIQTHRAWLDKGESVKAILH
jgi:hypothetical protein